MPETQIGDEAALRRDLAAAYRLVAHFGWDDLIATHISVRLPDHESFLINPFGMLFDEIRPSDLIKVDLDGTVIGETNWPVNRAGFVIHSAIHAARRDATCVFHLHTPDGIAVSALEDGLMPLNQTAMAVAQGMAYHDYEGVAVDMAERERIVADLGAGNRMILRNHGTLTLGASVADAFTEMYVLETACSIQVRTLAMGRPLRNAAAEAIARVGAMRTPGGAIPFAGTLVWPAMLRKLERLYPGWDA